MTDRTLRSFESDLRGWCDGGCDWRRLMVAEGDTGRGGVEEGDETSFHSEPELEKKLFVGAHVWLSTSGGELLEGGVFASGLGEGEGALAMTASGGRMLNI